MKRILSLIFIGTAVLFSSCTSDAPQPRKASVTATIDGVHVVFNTININQHTYIENDVAYTDLRVTASINNSMDETISFVVEENILGPNASWYFAYFLNQTAFPKMPDFAVDVTDNTGHHLEGTFSGKVQADDETAQIIDIENGVFDIIY